MLNVIVSLQEYLSAALRRDDRGATAVEYGLLVALIAAVIVTSSLLSASRSARRSPPYPPPSPALDPMPRCDGAALRA